MKIQDIKAMKTRKRKSERWLRSKGHLLLLQRTGIQFPEPNLGSLSPVTPAPHPTSSSSLLGHLYSCSVIDQLPKQSNQVAFNLRVLQTKQNRKQKSRKKNVFPRMYSEVQLWVSAQI